MYGFLLGLLEIQEASMSFSDYEDFVYGAGLLDSEDPTSEWMRISAQFLVRWIPVIGNAINASTAAGVTETIGWTIAKNFASSKVIAK